MPETPEIKRVYSTTAQNYRNELVPVICVEWTVSDEPLLLFSYLSVLMNHEHEVTAVVCADCTFLQLVLHELPVHYFTIMLGLTVNWE